MTGTSHKLFGIVVAAAACAIVLLPATCFGQVPAVGSVNLQTPSTGAMLPYIPRVPVPLSETVWSRCLTSPGDRGCHPFEVDAVKGSTDPDIEYKGWYLTGNEMSSLVLRLKVAVCDATGMTDPTKEYSQSRCRAEKNNVEVDTKKNNVLAVGQMNLEALPFQRLGVAVWFQPGALMPFAYSTYFELERKQR